MKTILIFFFALCVSARCALAYSENDGAKTISSDGTFSDTQDAVTYVDDKNQDGWVLTVGSASGDYTWASQLVVSIEHTFTIQGASAASRPTITTTYVGGFGLIFSLTTLKTNTIKDMIFAPWTASNACIFLGGSGVDTFRCTNLKFTGAVGGKMPFWVSSVNASPTGSAEAGPYGVFDNCRFEGSSSPTLGYVRNNDQLTSWQSAHSWDTSSNVFIEDCEFDGFSFNNGNPLVDGDQGCRIHVRHCTVINGSIGMHGSEGDNTKLDSGFQLQASNNTFTITEGDPGTVLDDGAGQMIFIRSGTARVWSNSFLHTTVGYYNVIVKTFYYRDVATDFGGNPTLADRDYVNGTGVAPDDYVGTQQPGSGYVGTTGADPNYPTKPWGVVPIRCWSNTYDNTPSFYYALSNAFTQLNRDFYFSHDDSAKPVGWAEYTYPHPLRGIAGGTGTGNRKVRGRTSIGASVGLR